MEKTEDYAKKRKELSEEIPNPLNRNKNTIKMFCKKNGIEFTRRGTNYFVSREDIQKIKELRPFWF